MTNYIKIHNTKIKKDYIDTFEKILNCVILSNNNDDNNNILSECKTKYYTYLLGLIVDERNSNKEDNYYSILDDTDVILNNFDIESFFKNKQKKKKYNINPDEPGPIDPLRIDFDL
jgi:hypothetical protein